MVTHRGIIEVEEAKLYTLPKKTPLLVGAAVTEKTAEWLGSWADGLITTSRKPDELKRMVDAFRRGGGEGKPLFLKVGLSYGRTDDEARRGCYDQWRNVTFANDLLTELRTPKEFDQAGKYVRPEDMDLSVRISSDAKRHIDWLAADIDLGFEELILHNINTNQEEFIDFFGEKVLPALKSRSATP